MCIGRSRGGLWGLQPHCPFPLIFKKMQGNMANTEKKSRNKRDNHINCMFVWFLCLYMLIRWINLRFFQNFYLPSKKIFLICAWCAVPYVYIRTFVIYPDKIEILVSDTSSLESSFIYNAFYYKMYLVTTYASWKLKLQCCRLQFIFHY